MKAKQGMNSIPSVESMPECTSMSNTLWVMMINHITPHDAIR